MSDPVTNVEIEDVLSSIRKLVADEKRTAPTPRTPPAAPGRLVLTPAQRITVAPDRSEKPNVPSAPEEPVLLTDPVLSDRAERPMDEIPGTARLSEFGQVEGAFPDFEDVETAQASDPFPASQSEGDAPNEARLELDRLIEEEVAAALSDVKDVDWDDDTKASAEHDDSDDEDWSEFLDDDQDMPDYAEDVSDDVPLADTVDETEEADADVAAPPPPLVTLEDKVAALGRLVARSANDFEEERDTPADVDLTMTADAMAWPDPAPFVEMVEPDDDAGSNVLRSETAWARPTEDEDQKAEPEPETGVEEPATAAPEVRDVPAMALDEEMLRELVVEIVRSELQGALGERITRNVRKLVRREIHRMLISQEFE